MSSKLVRKLEAYTNSNSKEQLYKSLSPYIGKKRASACDSIVNVMQILNRDLRKNEL
jgi:hypothetical protein